MNFQESRCDNMNVKPFEISMKNQVIDLIIKIDKGVESKYLENIFNHNFSSDPKGYVLFNKVDEIVGFIGTIFASRNGMKTCNITSYIVMEKYRIYSLKLVKEVLNNEGVTFTTFTAIEPVSNLFSKMKFIPLTMSKTIFLLPNLKYNNQINHISSIEEMIELVNDNDKTIILDHKNYNINIDLFVNKSTNEYCLIISNKFNLKNINTLSFYYVSNDQFFSNYNKQISSKLSKKYKCILGIIPDNFKSAQSVRKIKTMTFEHSMLMYKSDNLETDDIDMLYSEMILLQIA